MEGSLYWTSPKLFFLPYSNWNWKARLVLAIFFLVVFIKSLVLSHSKVIFPVSNCPWKSHMGESVAEEEFVFLYSLLFAWQFLLHSPGSAVCDMTLLLQACHFLILKERGILVWFGGQGEPVHTEPHYWGESDHHIKQQAWGVSCLFLLFSCISKPARCVCY